MIIHFMSDKRAEADNRVVDVLRKLVAECLPDFFVRLASKTVGSSVTRDIRYGFETPCAISRALRLRISFLPQFDADQCVAAAGY